MAVNNIQIGAETSQFREAMRTITGDISTTFQAMKSLERGAKIGLAVTGQEQLKTATANIDAMKEKIKILNNQRTNLIAQGFKESDNEVIKLDNQIRNLNGNLVIAKNKAKEIKFNESFTAKAQAGLEKFNAKLEGLKNTANKVSIVAGGALAGIFAAGKGEVETQSSAIAALTSVEKARFAGLENNVAKTKATIGEIAKTNFVNEGDLDAAAAFGASFVNTNQQLKDLTKGAVVLTQGFTQRLNPGADAFKNTMNAVGKAVATGNIGALKKQGVTLDDATISAFKLANATQRTAMIAKIAQDNYGNVSAELAKTPVGAMDKLNTAWLGFAQAATEKVIPVLLPFIDRFTSFLGSLDGNQITMIVAALGGLVVLSPIVNTITTLSTLIGSVVGGFGTLVMAITGAGTAAEAMGVIMSFAFGPIGLAITGITALIAGAIFAWNTNFFGFRDFLTGLWTGIVNTFTTIWGAISGFVSGLFTGIWNTIKFVIGLIIGSVTAATAPIWLPFKLAIDVIRNNWGAITGFFNGIWTTIKNIFSPVVRFYGYIFGAAFGAIKNVFNNVGGFFSGVLTAIGNVWNGIYNVIKTPFENAWNWIKDTITNIGKFIKIGIGNLIRVLPFGDKIADALGFGKEGKATGGYVNNSGIYRVNERGQELVKSGNSLSMLTGDYAALNKGDKVINATTAQARYGQQQPINQTININISNAQNLDENELAKKIKDQLVLLTS